MSKINKQLLIIQNISKDLLNNLDHEHFDFLCIDTYGMIKLNKKGIPFLSFYDFYDREEFLKFLTEKLNTLKEIFRRLDIKYSDILDYPNAFTGNYYLFLVYFADFIFISEVASRLKNEYQNIFIYTQYKKEDLEKYRNNIRINILEAFSIIDNREILIILLLCETLNASLIYSEPENKTEKITKCDTYISILSNSNYSILWSYLLDKINEKISIKKNKKTKVIFSIELSNEPKYLCPYMDEYNFVNPLHFIPKKGLEKRNIPDFLETESHLIKSLTALESDIFLNLLKIYHRDVISFMPSFIDKINDKINHSKPACVFFSHGQISTLENIVAFLSNKYRIPVFNFQHGSDPLFFDRLEFYRYIELVENIEKTLIVTSKKQYDFLNESIPANTKIFHGGSCKLFDYFNKLPKKIKNNKKVLIITGLYPAEAYKDLAKTETDIEIFVKHNIIFGILKKYNVNFDLKIFPIVKSLDYFKEISQLYEINHINIISQPNVEFLLPKYDMIIMEYIGSALTPLLMTLKVPVVYYINKDFININGLEDFCRRFYLVTNGNEFESIIKQFKEGKLQSKYSEESIIKFCFPSLTTNPAQEITKHVKSQIFDTEKKKK